MPKKNKPRFEFPGRDTHSKHGWWTARDDTGTIRTFRWDIQHYQWPKPNDDGVTGAAIEWPEKKCRLHMCSSKHCAARHSGTKRGPRGPCEHVRFIGEVPEEEAAKLFLQLCDLDEEAAKMDAVPAGGASSGDAVVVPSSAMGGGPAGVSPTVATDMHSAVAEVPCE